MPASSRVGLLILKSKLSQAPHSLQATHIESVGSDPSNGRFKFRFTGNHFTRGITLQGFVALLKFTGWDLYDVAERKKLSWLTDTEKNGYDLTEIVIPAYMAKIGLEYLSLVEAIAGVPEGACRHS
jgi:hypothetical protein